MPSAPPSDAIKHRAELAAADTTPARRPRRHFVNAMFDNVFLILGAAAAIWLAWLILSEGFSAGWGQIWFYLIFWVVLAYLVLPRLHHILTAIYVPNYFIGRARTSDGLLGDPINLALRGTSAQVQETLEAAGWTRADDVSFASSWRIVMATVLRRSYDEAPVSPLLLFGRKQDFAYQMEMAGNPAKRHHVRFWRCPDGWMLPGGHQVDYLAAGTFDRSVGFSLFTLQITHKIEENTDVERDFIVESLTEADGRVRVDVIKDFSTGYHARNGGGDTIITDGDLPIIDMGMVAEPAPTAAPVSAGQQPTAAAAIRPEKPRRPMPTVFGAVMVILRAIMGVLVTVLVLANWAAIADELVAEGGGTRADAETVLAVLIVVLGVILVLETVCAVFVLRGHNWARIAVLGLSSLSVLVAVVDVTSGGPQVTLNTNLLTLSFDILILLALSSPASRVYARQHRSQRPLPA